MKVRTEDPGTSETSTKVPISVKDNKTSITILFNNAVLSNPAFMRMCQGSMLFLANFPYRCSSPIHRTVSSNFCVSFFSALLLSLPRPDHIEGKFTVMCSCCSEDTKSCHLGYGTALLRPYSNFVFIALLHESSHPLQPPEP